MDGLLVIDKPVGITSHDVVNRVRRILGTRRVGHTGTLDPFATGVMVVVLGRATRLAQFLDKDEKEYEATVRFGFETDTGDATGTPKTEAASPTTVRAGEVEAVLPQFTGEIDQVPPMYSAKKIGGKRLYESARKGIEIERRPVRVTIEALGVIDRSQDDTDTVRIRVICSAGTYIRTLAQDIGRAVGVGAHLTQLRRTRSGRFHLGQALTLDALADTTAPANELITMAAAVEHLPEFVLPMDRVDPTLNGLPTRIQDRSLSDGMTTRMISPERQLLAIGVFSAEANEIKPKVVLV
jgi:tRNA pseudouridine55 synthase